MKPKPQSVAILVLAGLVGSATVLPSRWGASHGSRIPSSLAFAGASASSSASGSGGQSGNGQSGACQNSKAPGDHASVRCKSPCLKRRWSGEKPVKIDAGQLATDFSAPVADDYGSGFGAASGLACSSETLLSMHVRLNL